MCEAALISSFAAKPCSVVPSADECTHFLFAGQPPKAGRRTNGSRRLRGMRIRLDLSGWAREGLANLAAGEGTAWASTRMIGGGPLKLDERRSGCGSGGKQVAQICFRPLQSPTTQRGWAVKSTSKEATNSYRRPTPAAGRPLASGWNRNARGEFNCHFGGGTGAPTMGAPFDGEGDPAAHIRFGFTQGKRSKGRGGGAGHLAARRYDAPVGHSTRAPVGVKLRGRRRVRLN